jgi:Fe-S oxidoreductase
MISKKKNQGIIYLTNKMTEEKEKTKCTLCGLCKIACPAFRILLEESVSPRGKATLLKRGIPAKQIFLCTLCKKCEHVCILKDIDIVEKIRDYRQELVDLGMSTDAARRMMANIRKFGNTIGPIEKGKKVELFCC